MMLDLPELLAPKMRVIGRMGMVWVSPNALKFPIESDVSMGSCLVVGHGEFVSQFVPAAAAAEFLEDVLQIRP